MSDEPQHDDAGKAIAETLRVTRAIRGLAANHLSELLQQKGKLGNPVGALRDVHVIETSLLQKAQIHAHRERLAEAMQNDASLVQYLSELGMSPREICDDWLERDFTSDEREAFRRGQRVRNLEARALELAAARLGTAKPPEWMKKRFQVK